MQVKSSMPAGTERAMCRGMATLWATARSLLTAWALAGAVCLLQVPHTVAVPGVLVFTLLR